MQENILTRGPEGPLVSVIVPAFNAQDTIGMTLSGIFTQTYPHIEVIVVDDGSTDRTAEIVAAYGDNIRLIQQENKGLSGARNTGIRVAKGELLALNDADDMLLPEFLFRAVATLQEEQAHGNERIFVTCQAHYLSPGGIAQHTLIKPDRLTRIRDQRLGILRENFVSIFSVLPRELCDDIGFFDESFTHAEDWEYWIRAIFAGWRAVWQKKPLALYRRTGGSLSTQREKMYAAEDQLLKSAFEREKNQLRPEERAYFTERLSQGSLSKVLSDAEQALREQRYDAARELFVHAAVRAPWDKKLQLRAFLARYEATARVLGSRLRDRETRMGFTETMRT